MKTQQETFDTVAKHLLTQGTKSKKGQTCMYRAPDGTKCAIGCLMADEDYSNKMEQHSFMASMTVRNAVGKSGHDVSMWNDDFFSELQHIHDGEDVAGWFRALQDLAKDFNLKFNFNLPAREV